MFLFGLFSRERLRRVLRKKAAVILHLHTFTSADLLSLFFLFSLKAGAVPPERHETQPFHTKWTLDVKN
jgi:hypothetical protein